MMDPEGCDPRKVPGDEREGGVETSPSEGELLVQCEALLLLVSACTALWKGKAPSARLQCGLEISNLTSSKLRDSDHTLLPFQLAAGC